jgi:hypothetical protein
MYQIHFLIFTKQQIFATNQIATNLVRRQNSQENEHCKIFVRDFDIRRKGNKSATKW